MLRAVRAARIPLIKISNGKRLFTNAVFGLPNMCLDNKTRGFTWPILRRVSGRNGQTWEMYLHVNHWDLFGIRIDNFLFATRSLSVILFLMYSVPYIIPEKYKLAIDFLLKFLFNLINNHYSRRIPKSDPKSITSLKLQLDEWLRAYGPTSLRATCTREHLLWF